VREQTRLGLVRLQNAKFRPWN